MKDENDKLFETMLTMNSSSNIILYIGFSFVILGVFNTIASVPPEYVVSVSCAAFFFVFSDYIGLDISESKISKVLQPFFLFFGVFSFIGIPVILLTYPKVFDDLLQSSESFTIISLGVVLIILNRKAKESQTDFHKIIQSKFSRSSDIFERTEAAFDSLNERIYELEKENESLKHEINSK